MSTQTDPTFYRSPSEAAAAPTEKLAYVVAFDRAGEKSDALTVLDVDPDSSQPTTPRDRPMGCVASAIEGALFIK